MILIIQKLKYKKKINNYESTNRLFQQNFNDMKEELLNQLDEINNIKKEDIIKIQEETFGQIKEYDNNLKQLFEYTQDDIEVLKKKSDTLESLLKNTRNEMKIILIQLKDF